MDVTKPYKFIGFGAMDVTKPYKSIGFGAINLAKLPTSIDGFPGGERPLVHQNQVLRTLLNGSPGAVLLVSAK